MKARCAALLAFLLLIPFADLASHTVARNTVACNMLTVPVSVTNKSGQPVEGLTAANFKARFRGKSVRILSAKLNRRPRRVLLMLDESGSMEAAKWNAKWRLAVAIAADFTADLRSQDKAGLEVFGIHLREVTPLTTDHLALLRELKALSTLRKPDKTLHGGTAIWDSALAAARTFIPPRLGDAIFVVTDGEDDQSHHSLKAAARQLMVDNIRVFAFRVYDWSAQPGRFNLSATGRFNLALFARLTGGEAQERTEGPSVLHPYVYPLPDAPSDWRNFLRTGRSSYLHPLIATLWGQIREFYELELAVPKRLKRIHGWKLKVKPPAGTKAKGLYLSYPRELVPCSATNKWTPAGGPATQSQFPFGARME